MLLQPGYVVLAGKCGINVTSVHFGEHGSEAVHTVDVVGCHRTNMGFDLTTCRLSSGYDGPMAPPVFGCVLDAIGVGTPVVTVGFSPSASDPLETKHWGYREIASIDRSTGKVTLAVDGKEVTCLDDGNSIVFVQTANGSWRTLAIATTTPKTCDGTESSTHVLAAGTSSSKTRPSTSRSRLSNTPTATLSSGSGCTEMTSCWAAGKPL